MNINDNYQKRRGQTTSFPTGGIIEPNKKYYLESNSFYPLSNLIYREYTGRHRKVNRGNEFAKKKDPLMGSFMVLPKQVFPCFHCFSKTTPSHINRLCQ